MKELRDVAPTSGGVFKCHDTKLKRVNSRSKILLSVAALLAVCLAGCPTPPRAPPPPAEHVPPASIVAQPPHLGRPYDVAASESLLTILVYRGGPLAKAGHNHVIASHALRGSLYVPVDPAGTTFEIDMPVTDLTVDEAALRSKENADEFPPEIPDSAKEGTRRNMLSTALLDGDHYPDIVLRSDHLEYVPGSDSPEGHRRPGSPGGSNDANAPAAPTGSWLAHLQVTVRDKTSPVVIPVRYEQHADEIIVSGEFPLKQTDLGLTPFSALMGALLVVDEMKVRFRIVAHAAVTQTGK